MVKRTPADRDGGSDPVWNYDMTFDVVDQYMLDLEVLHQSIEIGGTDVSLGAVQLSLLPVYRNGTSEFWTSLKQKKATGVEIREFSLCLSGSYSVVNRVHRRSKRNWRCSCVDVVCGSVGRRISSIPS
jgi:hypothetical protein